MVAALATPLEIWGGIECSVNRIGEQYHNQLELGGHASRLEDLDRIAGLGIRTVRYPFLWELTARGPELMHADWSWCDERLARIQALDLQPIAGFVHHGSGPPHTGLLDPNFADALAEYAGVFARRYPGVMRFTPINEPLTTARFSTLYGLWFPHERTDAAFARAIVNECRATALAMQAIRAVQPAAQLVQTEDLGRVFSTAPLEYQARFENHRRWLTWDLLCGCVGPAHALWRYLLDSGIRADELDWFTSNPCRPDVIGINHYVTSNRFLEHRIERFAPDHLGGNGHDTYADVEAVRVLPDTEYTFSDLLDEAWHRYRIPVAITEVHLGCTREEQMRWFFQAWNAAAIARRRGCDVRAITAWSLFGSHDWASLLTRFEGAYESGAWDVRSTPPRRTALAKLVEDLAHGRVPPPDSWLRLPGWWQRESRLLHSIRRTSDTSANASISLQIGRPQRQPRVRPALIAGASGTLGRALARACEQRGLPHRLVSRQEMDIADSTSVEQMLDECDPSAVLNAAGYVRVDDAEQDQHRCERENVVGARTLADVCAIRDLPLVTFSSDLVFDGLSDKPYVETDPTNPLCVYGETKARAERLMLERHTAALVIRTSAFFGPWDDYNFLTVTLRALARGETVHAADDLTVSPTFVPDLAHVTLDLLLDHEQGLWHLSSRGNTSWFGFARQAAALAGLPVNRLIAVPHSEFAWQAARPIYSVLGSARGDLMPTLESALTRYIREAAHWLPAATAAPLQTAYAA
jgi:dTDP-4-dehydrorhamnose reductase